MCKYNSSKDGNDFPFSIGQLPVHWGITWVYSIG